jgi:hypothetical protein
LYCFDIRSILSGHERVPPEPWPAGFRRRAEAVRVQTIEVRRDAIAQTRVVAEPEPQPGEGQALLRIDRFTLSANNITYARLGEELGYWRFFPAAPGWGRLPVWAYAEVAASDCETLVEGRRLLGLFPMSDYLLITPDRQHPGGFSAGCEHRRGLPGLYNAYRWLDADPSYDPAIAGQQLVLRPSFWLSFLFDEHLRDHDDFGADLAIITSASSKSSLGLAHLLAGRPIATIGLTAPQRVAPLRALGLYDRVEGYPAASGLPVQTAVLADLAGDAVLRAVVHERLGEALRHSALLGTTRGTLSAGNDELPGTRPEVFFVPDQLRDRARSEGFTALDRRFAAALASFAARSAPWLDLVTVTGADRIQAAYRDLLDGARLTAPGLICRIES